MAKKVEIELISAGVQELLKSPEMGKICAEIANGIAGRAGNGHEVTTRVGKTRVNARVSATTKDARRANLKDNVLLKAIHG